METLLRRRLDLRKLERADDGRAKLMKILDKARCLECGKCCTASEGKFFITVFSKEANYPKLKELAKMHRKSIGPVYPDGFEIKSEDHCPFLEIKEEGKKCSIYEIRPLVCRSFPFMIDTFKTTDMNGKIEEKSLVVLTSLCLPIKEAWDAGVTYVSSKDIRPPLSGKRSKELPILSDSLRALYEGAGPRLSKDAFLEQNGSRIFLIF